MEFSYEKGPKCPSVQPLEILYLQKLGKTPYAFPTASYLEKQYLQKRAIPGPAPPVSPQIGGCSPKG